jgi:hypothetical protein
MEEFIEKKIKIVERKQKYKELIDHGGNISKKLDCFECIDIVHEIVEIIRECETVGKPYLSKAKVENTSEYLMDAQVRNSIGRKRSNS